MKPGIYHQTFYHDDNCPTLLTRSMDDCNCEPEVKSEKAPNDEFTKNKLREDFKNFWKKVSGNN